MGFIRLVGGPRNGLAGGGHGSSWFRGCLTGFVPRNCIMLPGVQLSGFSCKFVLKNVSESGEKNWAGRSFEQPNPCFSLVKNNSWLLGLLNKYTDRHAAQRFFLGVIF